MKTRRAISYIPATMATVIILVLFTASVLYMNSKYAEYISVARENNAAAAQAAKENLLLGFSGQDVMVLNQGGQSVALKTLLTVDKNGVAQSFDLGGAVVAQGSSLIEKSSSISTTNGNALAFVQAGGSIGILSVLGSVFWIGLMASTTAGGSTTLSSPLQITVIVNPNQLGTVSWSGVASGSTTTQTSFQQSSSAKLDFTAAPFPGSTWSGWTIFNASPQPFSSSAQSISLTPGSSYLIVIASFNASPPGGAASLAVLFTDLLGGGGWWTTPRPPQQTSLTISGGGAQITQPATILPSGQLLYLFPSLPPGNYSFSAPSELTYKVPYYVSLSQTGNLLGVKSGNTTTHARFVMWSSGSTQLSTTIPVSGPVSVSAVFQAYPISALCLRMDTGANMIWLFPWTGASPQLSVCDLVFSSPIQDGYPVQAKFQSSTIHDTRNNLTTAITQLYLTYVPNLLTQQTAQLTDSSSRFQAGTITFTGQGSTMLAALDPISCTISSDPKNFSCSP